MGAPWPHHGVIFFRLAREPGFDCCAEIALNFMIVIQSALTHKGNAREARQGNLDMLTRDALIEIAKGQCFTEGSEPEIYFAECAGRIRVAAFQRQSNRVHGEAWYVEASNFQHAGTAAGVDYCELEQDGAYLFYFDTEEGALVGCLNTMREYVASETMPD